MTAPEPARPTMRVRGTVAAGLVTAVIVAILVLAKLVAPVSRNGVDAVDPTPNSAVGGAAVEPTSAAATQVDDASEIESQERALFRPEDLVLLESADRAVWQKPEQVMDALSIADGSHVADLGAGSGWFTIRLARRVGPNGMVYAQDLQPQMVTAISRRVKREGFKNVCVIQGGDESLNLPTSALDAVLVVDVYPEVKSGERETFLRQLAMAVRPKGRIGIVNYKPGGGGPGPEPEDRVESAVVEKDARAANLHVLSRTDLKYQYLIVLGLQPASDGAAGASVAQTAVRSPRPRPAPCPGLR